MYYFINLCIYISLSTWEDRIDMILDLYQTQRWIQYSALQDGDAGLQNHTAQNLISELGLLSTDIIKFVGQRTIIIPCSNAEL